MSTDPPRIGRYELLQTLGDVGGRRQYLARISGETRNGQLFVVRVVASADAEPLALALASRIKAVAPLRHQNVLGLRDAGITDDGAAYLVTRYVEGYPLAELQRRAPEIPARIALALAVDALHGLHALHATGDLVHGNIAPDALFVGSDGMCRISDLGDAELRGSAIGYRAPEQLLGAPIDRRTDLFALGTVLWNALTGKTLYECDADVLEREPPRPSGVGLRPPAILDPLVLRALARDPERRFATADEMARTLRDLATRTACLAARTEIADWVAAVCQDELEVRRRSIRDLALPPAPPPSQPLPAVLPPARPSRRTPLVVAAAFALAFAAVAWRWVATAPSQVTVAPALEITVLDVTALADPSPPPVAAPAIPEPVKPIASTAVPTASSVTKVKPPRAKTPRPVVSNRPAITAPAAVPVPPAETPVTKKPETKAPPMENNPYVYK